VRRASERAHPALAALERFAALLFTMARCAARSRAIWLAWVLLVAHELTREL
jgi:hypothetical protein